MHRQDGKKYIQAVLVLVLLVLVFLHARKTENMQKQVVSYVRNGIAPETITVKNPRVNYVENPVGIDSKDLFFSWEPEGKQIAYALSVTQDGNLVWYSGVIRSTQTIQIPYRGPELEDGRRYDYRVFVLDGENRIYCSEEAYFETAYIDGDVFRDASLICMQPQENIYGDGVGYIPRPTDQLYNFSLFFQDYLPGMSNLKANIKLNWADGLPFGPPRSDRKDAVFRTPDYRRVDLGISYSLEKGKDKIMQKSVLKYLKSLTVGLDVLNLFDISNVNSYYWVTDVTNVQYAVPNYLTSRQVNVKLMLEF